MDNADDIEGVVIRDQSTPRTLFGFLVSATSSIVDYLTLPPSLSQSDLARYQLLVDAYRRNLQYAPQNTKNTATSQLELENAITSSSQASNSSSPDENGNGSSLTPISEVASRASADRLIQQATIPSYWTLDAKNRPTRMYNYRLFRRNLNTATEQLRTKNSEISFAQASMVALLAKYFDSILKRQFDYWLKDGLRNDGIEAMFFSEMIHWLLHVLPELPELESSTIAMVEQRALYCKEVCDIVFKNHVPIPGMPQRSLYRQKTKDTVFRLSQQMNCYHKNLEHQRHSMRFNHHVEQLNQYLLGLSEKSLNIFYALIKGSDKTHFIVEQFLNPYESDSVILTLQKTQLGRWLKKTLIASGITTSTYTSQTIISLEQSLTHLAGEHPQDDQCILTQGLKDSLNLKEWGHWDFVGKQIPSLDAKSDGISAATAKSSISPEESLRVSKYLTQIREAYRYIVRFQFIRQNLVRTTQVAAVFGEIWIYGDPVGKAVLKELLDGIEDEIKTYSKLFHEFWSTYYTNHYLPVAEKEHTNDIKFQEHLCLTGLAHNGVPALQQIIDSIKVCINAIRIQSQQLPSNIERATKTKKQLFLDVLAFLKFCGKQGSTNFNIIQNALRDLEQNSNLDNSSDTTVDFNTAQQAAENHIKQVAAENFQARIANKTYLEEAISRRIAEEQSISNARREKIQKQAREENTCTQSLLDNCTFLILQMELSTQQQVDELRIRIAEKEAELSDIESKYSTQIAEMETSIKAKESLRREGIFKSSKASHSAEESSSNTAYSRAQYE